MKKVKKLFITLLFLGGIFSSLYALSSNWLSVTEEQFVTVSDIAHFQGLTGASVAVSQDNKTLVALLSPSFVTDAYGFRIFSKDLLTDPWIQDDVFQGSIVFSNDSLYSSCSISGDGKIVAIAAHGEDVYIYEKVGNIWHESQVVSESIAASSGNFAVSVDLSFNGDVLAVGLNAFGLHSHSQVIIFERLSGSTYVETEIIDSYLDTVNDPHQRSFGASVALTDDGNRLAVGVPNHLPGEPPLFTVQGEVGYYLREATGWSLKEVFVASDGFPADTFGYSLDFSPGDGKRLLIGAPATVNVGLGLPVAPGKVYIRDVSLLGSPEIANFSPSDNQIDQRFGLSVSFAGDGKSVVVGSPNLSLNASNHKDGAVYYFEEVGGTWVEAEKILADPILPAEPDTFFGYSVAANSSQTHVGAPLLDLSATEINTGAIYTYNAHSLSTTTRAVSGATGGNFALDFCYDPNLLSGENYIVLGTFSSTTPGLTLKGFNIPLNLDSYFDLTLNTPFFSGVLDGSGQLSLSVAIPPGLSPAELNHALVVYDSSGQIQYVSNAVSLNLIP